MSRELHITRDGAALGAMTECEARELLLAGFLLTTDHYRAEGMPDTRRLSELESESKHDARPGLFAVAKETVSAAGDTVASHTARFTRQMKSIASRGGRLTESTRRLLDSFTPQIQKLVSGQLVKHGLERVQGAIHDDEFMTKLFGATYDCLPKPVYRFVPEKAFIQYCMERRQVLLGPRPGVREKA